MRARIVAVTVLVVLVLSLLSSLAYAAGGTPAAIGSSPETAGAPSSDWQPLDVGQRAWYEFHYAGDRSQIDIVLQEDVPGALDFTVWTPSDVKSWQGTGVETWVGEGHANAVLHNALGWSGDFNAGGTYYVIVDHTNGDPSLYVPASYLLKITGSGVSFPPRPAPRRTIAAPTAVPAGAAPGNAVKAAARDRGETLSPGQVRWYAFDAPGDNSQITVRLSSNPPNKATFSVWTLDEVQMLNAYGEQNPVGRSAPSSRYNGDQVWSGKFMPGSKYYVRVEQTGTDAPVTYQLQINQ